MKYYLRNLILAICIAGMSLKIEGDIGNVFFLIGIIIAIISIVALFKKEDKMSKMYDLTVCIYGDKGCIDYPHLTADQVDTIIEHLSNMDEYVIHNSDGEVIDASLLE